MLKNWLIEVKTSNDGLRTKVSELEKKMDELQECSNSSKVANKLKPSQEVRVSVHFVPV